MRASFDAGEICLLCVVGYPRARREDAFGASPILSPRYMYKDTGIAKRDIQLSLLDERPIRACSPLLGLLVEASTSENAGDRKVASLIATNLCPLWPPLPVTETFTAIAIKDVTIWQITDSIFPM